MHGRIWFRHICTTLATLSVAALCDAGTPGDPASCPSSSLLFFGGCLQFFGFMVDQQSPVPDWNHSSICDLSEMMR